MLLRLALEASLQEAPVLAPVSAPPQPSLQALLLINDKLTSFSGMPSTIPEEETPMQVDELVHIEAPAAVAPPESTNGGEPVTKPCVTRFLSSSWFLKKVVYPQPRR
jgi:hypothetical protein